MKGLVSAFTIWLFGRDQVRPSPDFQTSGTNRIIAQHIDGETEFLTAFSIQNFASKRYLNSDKSRMYAIYECLICSTLRNDNQLRTASLSVHWLRIWRSCSLAFPGCTHCSAFPLVLQSSSPATEHRKRQIAAQTTQIWLFLLAESLSV